MPKQAVGIWMCLAWKGFKVRACIMKNVSVVSIDVMSISLDIAPIIWANDAAVLLMSLCASQHAIL